MPKAEPLTPSALSVPQITPKAATSARTVSAPLAAPQSESVTKSESKQNQMPLQIRLPREEVRAIKIAAAEREQTISDFMLACFHAYMKDGTHA